MEHESYLHGCTLIPVDDGITQVITPFTVGDERRSICFFLERDGNKVLLHDDGVNEWNESKRDWLLTSRLAFHRKTIPSTVTLSGDFVLSVDLSDLDSNPVRRDELLADLVRAVILVSA